MENLVVLAGVLRTTTEKGRQLFEEKKCTPKKILSTPVILKLCTHIVYTQYTTVLQVAKGWCSATTYKTS